MDVRTPENNNNIIIIITLFQEDNIFGTGASLSPPLTDVDMLLKKKNRPIIIYSMYRVDALRTPSRLRVGYLTLFQWRGRYDFPGSRPGNDYHTSVLVIECFLTRSMRIGVV